MTPPDAGSGPDDGAAAAAPRATLLHGDAADVLATLGPGSCDAMVTDPPAGIGFMGLAFDSPRGGRTAWIGWAAGIFRQCRRALVPGAWAVAWSLPRTQHWTATALEDAGFQIRDVAVHLQAQGWPKSRACLKPAAEFWTLARVPGPLRPLDIDAARIGTSKQVPASPQRGPNHVHGAASVRSTTASGSNPSVGRWPANVTLQCACAATLGVARTLGSPGRRDDDAHAPGCPVAMLDAQAGPLASGAMRAGRVRKNRGGFAGPTPAVVTGSFAADAGGASRFFYVAKVHGGEARAHGRHPTQKSVALTRWLVRLIAPPGGVVLDPFAGSGTTLLAALDEGRAAVGIEREAEYVAIGRARLAAAAAARAGGRRG